MWLFHPITQSDCSHDHNINVARYQTVHLISWDNMNKAVNLYDGIFCQVILCNHSLIPPEVLCRWWNMSSVHQLVLHQVRITCAELVVIPSTRRRLATPTTRSTGACHVRVLSFTRPCPNNQNTHQDTVIQIQWGTCWTFNAPDNIFDGAWRSRGQAVRFLRNLMFIC